MVGSRIKCGRELQTVGPAAGNRKGPTAVSVKPVSLGTVLQAVDGWRNAAAAECQHRRPERSSPTGTAVRGRSDTGELSLPA